MVGNEINGNDLVHQHEKISLLALHFFKRNIESKINYVLVK